MAKACEQGEALLLVDASGRLPLFRAIQLVALAVSAVLAFAGIEALQTGDGGGAMWQGVLAALLCLALVVVMLGGVLVFGLRSVLRLRWQGDQIEIETITPWGLHRFTAPASAVRLGAVHAPVVVTQTQRADAPWQVMRLDGWRLPFMIDLQASHLDHRGLNRLASQAKRLRAGG